jgi:hypothetical protein
MKFDRWVSADKYSYVFRLFNKYHTYMNSLFWAHVPASSYAQGIYRRAKKSDPTQTTHAVYNLSGQDSQRVTNSLDDYSKHLKEFDNWTRLNTLVAVSSYFEIYLSSIVSLALESDLGLLFSIPRRIDGVQILKYGKPNIYIFGDKSEEITKGTWSVRLSNYKKLFGSIPQGFSKYESELEKMRIIRNNVTHAFGRDISSTRSRATYNVLDINRLSLNRLKQYMGIIREVARTIDSHLLMTHIGEYELVHYYHSVRNQLRPRDEALHFKKKLNSLFVENKSHAYCKELIAYFNKL